MNMACVGTKVETACCWNFMQTSLHAFNSAPTHHPPLRCVLCLCSCAPLHNRGRGTRKPPLTQWPGSPPGTG